MAGRAKQRHKHVRCLVIEEGGMISAQLFENLHAVMTSMKTEAGDASACSPFGGVRIIMIADFHQLPPVPQLRRVPNSDELKRVKAKYCFESHLWPSLEFVPLRMTHSWRYDPNGQLSLLLNAIREGNMDIAWDMMLACNGDDTVEWEHEVLLCCKKYQAMGRCRHRLQQLPGEA